MKNLNLRPSLAVDGTNYTKWDFATAFALTPRLAAVSAGAVAIVIDGRRRQHVCGRARAPRPLRMQSARLIADGPPTDGVRGDGNRRGSAQDARRANVEYDGRAGSRASATRAAIEPLAHATAESRQLNYAQTMSIALV